MSKIFRGADGRARCAWCAATPGYMAYHDDEWGFPVADDRRLFEKLCLEGFQSGLSWRTILEKRENFRTAFAGFDIDAVARFGARDVARLLKDAGIVRHRGKIEAAINNARRAQDLIKAEGSLAAFVWRYAPKARRATATVPSTTAESIALSKELRKRGWKFVGPTTVYAFMQAVGMVNDHHEKCAFRKKAAAARKKFRVPG
jgi:DNA-3-methyladenine glycosylase I